MQDKIFTFEEKLSQAKIRLDLSWTELAERLDIGKTMLHYLRKGEREPSAKVIKRLSLLNECEPNHLQQVNEPSAFYGGGGAPKYLEERVADLESKYVEILEMFSELRNGQKKILRASEKNGGTADEH